MQKLCKRVIAVILTVMFAVTTCLATTPSAATTSVVGEKGSLFHENALKSLVTGSDANYDPKGGAADDEIVTIMVKLEDAPLLAVTSLDNATKSAEISAKLKARRDEAVKAVSAVAGEEIDVLFTYELLFNGFSFNGRAGLINEISKLDGIADCYRSMEWSLPEEVKVDAPLKVNTSSSVINADALWAAGYTGAGMTIAIIDTGIKANHSNFATVPSNPRFTSTGIQAAMNEYDMVCESLYNGTLTGTAAYYSAKIPFRFNYVTGTTDASHASASNDHGTHVSSIAAGHDTTVKGIAYDAQIIAMQVFNGGSAAWATIAAALEDCAYLGVDCLNMSLGSDCGFTTGDADMELVYELLYEHGVNVLAAAGNSAISGEGNAFSFQEALAMDPDNGIVSSPSTYNGSLSVAAGENSMGGDVTYFSSRGSTSDLRIKPEIMAPGDNIYAATDSTYSWSNYGSKSGTSMATPEIAGCSALLAQYLKDRFPNMTATERLVFVNNLLLSTAVPSSYSGNLPYSPRAQGAGMVDLEAAMNTMVYLAVEGSERPLLEIGDDPERTGLFTLEFDLVNFGSASQTYDISANVQTEEGAPRTVNGVQVYSMSGDPFDLTEDSVIGGDTSVTVPANSRASVTVTVDMSAYGEMLDGIFPNGIYVEGFVSLDNRGNGANLSIPYLGFYGNWGEAPVIDRTWYWDIIEGEASWQTHTYPNVAGSSYGSSSYLELGANPYMDVNEFYADHISISPNNDGQFDAVDVIYTGLLRNSRTLTYTVTNAETNEVIMTDVHEQVNKGTYIIQLGAFLPAGSYSGYAEFAGWSGEGLSEGETAIVTIDAALDYDGFDPEENDCASWSFPVTIDTSAPEFVYWRIEDGSLFLYATDTHYLAHVSVHSSANYAPATRIAEASVNERTRGKLSMFAFDIGDRETVYVQLGDYAGNTARATLTGEGGSFDAVALEGIEAATDSVEIYEGGTSALRINTTPIDANNFTVEWTSENANIATISGGFTSATVAGISAGTTTVIVTATDRDTSASFTDEIEIVVNDFPTISEAFNAPGRSFNFTSTGSNPWEVAFNSSGDAYIKSSIENMQSASSTVTSETLALEAGDVVSFEWMVSSERNYDKLIFYVNNLEEDSISGDIGWQVYNFTVPSDGNYTFKWVYSKDYSLDGGADLGGLDNFSIAYAGLTLGDVNGDGVVDVPDALLALRHGIGLITLTEDQIAAADIDGDGTVDTPDALIILRMAIGLA